MTFDRVVLVAGTRPEFVKLHPVAVALGLVGMNTMLVTTEQHSSPAMKGVFLEDLAWPCGISSLGISTTHPSELVAEIARTLPAHLESTDLVMVEGDTTSVLATSIVANKLGLLLAHVEAGLRSYDPRMPEEHNRRVSDHFADYLFAPTELDAGHLRDEHVKGRVFVVGNTVLDAVHQNIGRLAAISKLADGYILITLHRQENVDDPAFQHEVVRFLESVTLPCVFPVHPRTRQKFSATGLWDRVVRLPHVRPLEPLNYLAFLGAMRDARVILTDSGGVQEEATAPEIRRPVVVVRRSTERSAAVEAHWSVLAPPDATQLVRLVMDLSWFRPTGLSPFGDGRSGETIARILAAERRTTMAAK
jgi:UDP-N-acetylglucosamine 2-epimerase (non-hydrolysing)